METRHPTYPTNNVNLIDLMQRFPTPAKARDYLEAVRWPDGPVCPHCGTVNEATHLEGDATREGVYKCNACVQQFTVTVGTIFEASHIPLHKWVIVFHLLCANKKGISALSIHRMIGVTYKSVWHMCHRIRYAMRDTTFSMLDGTVEADEMYIGGKAKNVHNGKPAPKKTPVVALVERDGRVRARKVADVNAKTIGAILKMHIKPTAKIMTDGAPVYDGKVTDGFAGHEAVNHSAGIYVRGDAHTATVDSFAGLVKRSIVGAFHHVSEEHLDRYIDEVAFRWNTRRISDGDRLEVALRQTEGKRLMMTTPKGKVA